MPVHDWQVARTVPDRRSAGLWPPTSRSTLRPAARGVEGRRVTWRTARAVDASGQIDLGRVYSHDDDRAAYGYAEIAEPVGAEGADGRRLGRHADRLAQRQAGLRLRRSPRVSSTSRRGSTSRLRKGVNRVLIRCGNRGGPWQFAVAVTAPADFAFLKAPAARGFNPESLPRARARRAGEREPRPAVLQRPEGPGVHQVPRRGQGRGRRRARAVERRVPSTRATS